MARWTEYPHHFRPFRVLLTTPSTVAFMSWLMGNLDNAAFSACLTSFRSIRIPSIKTLNVVIGNAFCSAFVSISRYPVWVAVPPLAGNPRNLFPSTFIRTKPFLALVWSDRKDLTAISTFVFGDWIRSVFPSKCSTAFLRTKLLWPALVKGTGRFLTM